MSIEEVRALVAERQRYDDWIAALEAKRAETPARVFERVHGDYVGRRAEVITRLQSHVGELASFGGELEQRLADLETRLAAHEEELAEGMLRNLVGEYDDERWQAVRTDIEGKIDTLGTERSALLAEVEDVRALLASARVTPEVVEPTVEETPAAALPTPAVSVAIDVAVSEAPVLEETPLVVPAVSEVPARELTPAEEVSAIFSDVEPMVEPAVEPIAELTVESFATPAASPAVDDYSSVVLTPMSATEPVSPDDSLLDIDVSAMVDNPVPQGPSHEEVLADVAALFDTSSIAAVPEPETPSGKGPVTQSEVDDALAMFGEVTGPADQQFVQSLQGIEAEHDKQVDLSTATATPPAAPSANDPFDDLAFLRSVIDQGGATEVPPPAGAAPAPSSTGKSAEPQKTLRCTECGTMNLPTEWYCERCGGELAAF